MNYMGTIVRPSGFLASAPEICIEIGGVECRVEMPPVSKGCSVSIFSDGASVIARSEHEAWRLVKAQTGLPKWIVPEYTWQKITEEESLLS